jgi:hypothetical protein
MPSASSTAFKNNKKLSPALSNKIKALEKQCNQNKADLRLQAEQSLEIVKELELNFTRMLQIQKLHENTAAKQAEYDRVLCLLIAKIREHHATVRPILFKRIVTNGDVVAAAEVTLALRAETMVLQDYTARWHNAPVAPVVNHSDQFMYDLANTMEQCAGAAPVVVLDIAPDLLNRVRSTENLFERLELLSHSSSDSE